jgi:hypothetical protein
MKKIKLNNQELQMICFQEKNQSPKKYALIHSAGGKKSQV